MAGHSHWKQIKHHKGATDQKRAQVFSKLLRAITIAAKTESNPQFNPRLRTTIQVARSANIPNENINRAIVKASGSDAPLEEFAIEAYGPEGVAILIFGVTDNTNRTIQELKLILKENGAKFADPGSVRWAFIENKELAEWKPTFSQSITSAAANVLTRLVNNLHNHEDVHTVFHNAQNETLPL